MAQRTEQINVRITGNRKDEWDEFAENSQAVDGVSDLVRKAVTAYTEAGGDPTSVSAPTGNGTDVSGAIPENLSDRLASIEDELDGIASTVERTDETVGFIERKIVAKDDDTTFTDKLMGAIPPKEPGTDEWRKAREKYEGDEQTPSIGWDGTPEAISEVTDSDPTLVEQSIQSLRDQGEIDIETARVDGEDRYYVERDLTLRPFADGRRMEQESQRQAIADRQEDRR